MQFELWDRTTQVGLNEANNFLFIKIMKKNRQKTHEITLLHLNVSYFQLILKEVF